MSIHRTLMRAEHCAFVSYFGYLSIIKKGKLYTYITFTLISFNKCYCSTH